MVVVVVIFEKPLARAHMREKQGKHQNQKEDVPNIWHILTSFSIFANYYTLISTSTPQGSSSFISASTVLAVLL